MKKILLTLSAFFACILPHLFGSLETPSLYRPEGDLFRDLLIVDYWNKRLERRMPVTYNHLLYGGYWSMPSARMSPQGEMSLGYTLAPPYRLWSLRCQLTDRLEVSGNYRIFSGVDDPVLTQHGFGDFSDKGVNIKVALFRPEDSDYQLPGLAIGFEDFIGTKAFKADYVVLTHVFLDHYLELSLGYGRGRIRGLFGGATWFPFQYSQKRYLRNLAFSAEYDAIPYRNCHVEPHPKGRVQKSPFNIGLKYRFWDYFDFSASCIRGNQWAFSVSSFYNFGMTKGLVPKIDDPLPYVAPVNIEPLGALRPPQVLTQDLIYAFQRQGFSVLQSWLSFDSDCQKVLRLRIINNCYRLECDVRTRLNNLIAYLIPLDIAKVIVAIDCEGMIIQEYHYPMAFMRLFADKKIGPYELKILSPLCEASYPNPNTDWPLFHRNRSWFCPAVLPKSYTYFGSSTGKFKYAFGVQLLANGYLNNSLFYSVALGYIALENISDVKDVDRLNPSQLINVRTDIVRYYQQKQITLDEAYLQRTWNFGKGFYGRLIGGYLEVEYGGIGGELLYYPLHSDWAVALGGAIVKKRKFNSCFEFTNKIRKLKGFKPTYHHFLGSQYFLGVYYTWKKANIDLKIQMGKFLANDWGVRYEVSRYFPSGLRVNLWYTRTNGRDKINGQTYYDKGVSFSLPLDAFYTYCDRSVSNYGMSAWLRDVGVTAYTGQELYYMLQDNRP